MVTGHSLGAGTAALLAALLQRDYADIICFAFSPPGWLVRLVIELVACVLLILENFVCLQCFDTVGLAA